VPSPLDEEAEQAALALKEQAKRNKEQQKEQLIAMQKKESDLAKHAAAAATQVAAKSGSRFSGLANSDADRALRLAAVESRMGIVRCVQCNNIITGPCFDQMGFKYCSTVCINHHRKSLPN
jgi:hypothetical protein